MAQKAAVTSHAARNRQSYNPSEMGWRLSIAARGCIGNSTTLRSADGPRMEGSSEAWAKTAIISHVVTSKNITSVAAKITTQAFLLVRGADNILSNETQDQR